jgi:hypothetical protein
MLPLKNGAGQMEAGWVRNWEKSMRSLLEQNPEHFRALYAVVEGRSEEVDKALIRDLKRWAYIRRDGSPHPDVRAVMVAAVRETPDGLSLVDPVDVRTPEQAAAVKRFDEHREARQRQGQERLAPRRVTVRRFPV